MIATGLNPWLRIMALLIIAMTLLTCDGLNRTDLLDGNFLDSEKPTVQIDEPADGATNLYSQKLEIRGKAFDNRRIDRVEISLAGGAFQAVQGSNVWQSEIDTFILPAGGKTVVMRAYDEANNFAETAFNHRQGHHSC